MLLKRLFSTFSIRPRYIYLSLIGIPGYLISLLRFKYLLKASGLYDWSKLVMFPVLTDKYESSGTASGHYFWQDLLIAQRIFKQQPIAHLDIGSRMDGFVSHLASFREVVVLDIRRNIDNIPNIRFLVGDLTLNSSLSLLGKYDSISCLHVLEHIGLGRYGDSQDPKGHLLAINNIDTLLMVGGHLYLSVPIGIQRIEYNAHRIFAPDYLPSLLDPSYELLAFSYVDDFGDLVTTEGDCLPPNQEILKYAKNYGCGIYVFKKLKSLQQITQKHL